MTAPLLSLEKLGIAYPVGTGLQRSRLHAVSEFDLQVQPGEIVSIVGESGSGKSTVARLVLRLDAPTAGAIRFDGHNVLKTEPRGASKAYRRRVQLIFQDPFASLNPAHPIRHHLERPLRLHGRATAADVRDKAIALLDSVGLGPGADFIDRRPHELSGGQRQRVAIARALAPEPDLLFADEPTSMLDVSIRMDVLRLLKRLRDERGLAVVMITHDLAAARWLSDRIVVMYAGRIMEVATADRITTAPAHPYTRLLIEAAPRPHADIRQPLPARPGRPQTIDPPAACPFAARCPRAQPDCSRQFPPLTTLGDDHHAACLYPETDS